MAVTNAEKKATCPEVKESIIERKNYNLVSTLFKCFAYKYETERMVFYENESCMEGSRFLTLRIKFWRKQNGKPNHHP